MKGKMGRERTDGGVCDKGKLIGLRHLVASSSRSGHANALKLAP